MRGTVTTFVPLMPRATAIVASCQECMCTNPPKPQDRIQFASHELRITNRIFWGFAKKRNSDTSCLCQFLVGSSTSTQRKRTKQKRNGPARFLLLCFLLCRLVAMLDKLSRSGKRRNKRHGDNGFLCPSSAASLSPVVGLVTSLSTLVSCAVQSFSVGTDWPEW